MFTGRLFWSARRKRFSPWWSGLKLGAIAAIIVWWWLQEKEKKGSGVEDQRVVLPLDDGDTPPAAPKAAPVKPKTKKQKLQPIEPDDLTVIEGIGPKYAGILQAAGVKSYADLAKMTPEEVREIFRKAVNRSPDPTTWIKQAAKLKK